MVKEKEALETGIQAYIYAYPLVMMGQTLRVSTNVATPEYKTIVAPNADTLYSVLWLDVGKEPWIVSVPNMKGRYFMLPLLDGWTTVFAVPGTRTTGTGAQKFAITGPGWTGTLPAGVKEYKSPTAIAWLLGRIYSTGTPEDYRAVHALQDQMVAVPLSAYSKSYTAASGTIDPSVDMKTATRAQVHAMDAASFFKLFAQLLKTNPPSAEDAPMLATLAKIGIVPRQDFDASKLDPVVAKGLANVPKPAQDTIMAWMKEGFATGDWKLSDGWIYSTKMGVYGTNYRWRALIASIAIGANLAEDAVYPLSYGPDIFTTYSGAHKYLMHFNEDDFPPVEGFWSLTMYNEQQFLVPNPINRYTVSQRNKFKTNADGSVDVYIQNESPGQDKEQNWLPAPKNKFMLTLRMYRPKEKSPSILNSTWNIPPVRKVN